MAKQYRPDHVSYLNIHCMLLTFMLTFIFLIICIKVYSYIGDFDLTSPSY